MVADNKTVKEETSEHVKKPEESKDTITVLENKMEMAYAQLYEHFKELEASKDHNAKQGDEIKLLKTSLKTSNLEKEKIICELSSVQKSQKSTDKEIYNLEKKTNNQQNTIANLKETKKRLKEESKRLEGEKRKPEKKVSKLNHNPKPLEIRPPPPPTLRAGSPSNFQTSLAAMSTSTLSLSPRTPAVSTSGTQAITDSPNTSLTCSPRTPHGTPPRDPPQSFILSDTPPGDLSEKKNPIKDLKDMIARDKPSFDELLQAVKNSKWNYEDSDHPKDEDTYSEIDYDQYPESYWEVDQI